MFAIPYCTKEPVIVKLYIGRHNKAFAEQSKEEMRNQEKTSHSNASNEAFLSLLLAIHGIMTSI